MKKKMMELTTQTHKVIETVKATIEAANEKLRRANANLSQLWVTAKETLNKMNENEEKIKEIIKSKVKLQEELKRQLKENVKGEITELHSFFIRTSKFGLRLAVLIFFSFLRLNSC